MVAQIMANDLIQVFKEILPFFFLHLDIITNHPSPRHIANALLAVAHYFVIKLF